MEKKKCSVMQLVTLSNLKCVGCSPSGTPKFFATWSNDKGEIVLSGETATDANCSFAIRNFQGGQKKANVYFHMTPKGNKIKFDYIDDVLMKYFHALVLKP